MALFPCDDLAAAETIHRSDATCIPGKGGPAGHIPAQVPPCATRERRGEHCFARSSLTLRVTSASLTLRVISIGSPCRNTMGHRRRGRESFSVSDLRQGKTYDRKQLPTPFGQTLCASPGDSRKLSQPATCAAFGQLIKNWSSTGRATPARQESAYASAQPQARWADSRYSAAIDDRRAAGGIRGPQVGCHQAAADQPQNERVPDVASHGCCSSQMQGVAAGSLFSANGRDDARACQSRTPDTGYWAALVGIRRRPVQPNWNSVQRSATIAAMAGTRRAYSCGSPRRRTNWDGSDSQSGDTNSSGPV